MITVLCGGVGAARFMRALAGVHPPDDTVGVVNTADDTVMHGLSISPDLDTVTYTLADAIDRDRGWGLGDETFRTMSALDRFRAHRPASSAAGDAWFGLGDLDLATHLYRTGRRAEGADLTTITAEVCAAFGVRQRLLPMTDQAVRTMVTLTTGDEVSFQEYFVKLRHAVAVSGIRFAGADTAVLTTSARAAIVDAEVVVVAPSNPLVSIAPLRALHDSSGTGLDALLTNRRDSVVAVSPIVGGAALKGPADRMLTELGAEPSVVGVARLYAPIAAALVIDPVDAHLADAVEAAGMRAVVCPSVMSDPDVAAHLARTTVGAARR